MQKPLSTYLRLALPAVALVAVFSSSLAAQAQSDTASFDDSTARAQRLETVRVSSERVKARYAPAVTRSAMKTPALARDVPQSVTVVSKALIRDQGMQGMADVVRYIPGVTMGQGEGHRDAPTIRGNATTADFFVDGVRDDVQYLRDVYTLERVEALKGANAMIFGRGGGGGAINRVSKEALWATRREITAETGEYGKRRVSSDIEQSVSSAVAARLNTMYENSNLYRDGVSLERSGFNPTLTVASDSRATRLALGYEHFRDYRTADRGVPSFNGLPLATDRSTFFGNADDSYARAIVN